MATRIQLRRGTAAEWTTANPILAHGEPGLETDTNKIKYGDGLSSWSALPYSTSGSGGGGGGGVAVPAALNLVFDGDGSALVTGMTGDVVVPFNCTITDYTIIADQAGDIAFDLMASSFASAPPTTSIVASAPPALSNAAKVRDTSLTGWSTDLAAGDILRATITSASTVQRATLSLTLLPEGGDAPVPTPTTYHELVLSEPSLVAYWRLADQTDTTGTYPLQVGATGTGAVVAGDVASLVPSETDAATEFSSTACLYTEHDDVFNSSGDFTLELWATSEVPAAAYAVIAGKGTDTDPLRDWRLARFSDGRLRFSIYGSDGTMNLNGAATFDENYGEALHIVVRKSGTTVSLFENGVLVDSDTAPTSRTPATPVAIGGWSTATAENDYTTWGNYWYAGVIDDVSWYSTGLSNATIQAHYQMGSGE